MEISGQVKLDLFGGIGAVEDLYSWQWQHDIQILSIHQFHFRWPMLQVLDLILSGAPWCVIYVGISSCISLIGFYLLTFGVILDSLLLIAKWLIIWLKVVVSLHVLYVALSP